jgi:hypothetical protein
MSQTLRQRIDRSEDLRERLDALVHDTAARVASRTINDGVAASLAFLHAEGVTDEEIREALDPIPPSGPTPPAPG